jgi:hypothetical protein
MQTLLTCIHSILYQYFTEILPTYKEEVLICSSSGYRWKIHLHKPQAEFVFRDSKIN